MLILQSTDLLTALDDSGANVEEHLTNDASKAGVEDNV